MKLLAVDASSTACSAALAVDDAFLERFEVTPHAHATLLLPMVESLLAEAELAMTDLDGFAFGRGPGSFTGLRIAAGVIQGLAYAVERPVAPVSSLAALGQGAEAEWVLAAFDARMGEVYLGAYRRDERGLMRPHGEESVTLPEQASVPLGQAKGAWTGVGEGWKVYGSALRARLEALVGPINVVQAPRFPHAREVARLGLAGLQEGRAVSAEQAVPIYLRDNVAHRG